MITSSLRRVITYSLVGVALSVVTTHCFADEPVDISNPIKPLWERDLGKRGGSIALASNEIVLAGSAGGRITFIHPKAGRITGTLDDHSQIVNEIEIAAVENLAAAVASDGRVRLIDTILRRKEGKGCEFSGRAERVALSFDGKFALIYVDDGEREPTLVMADVAAGKTIHTFEIGDLKPNPKEIDRHVIRELALNSTADKAYIGLNFGVVVLDIKKRAKEFAYPSPPTDGTIMASAASADLATCLLWHSAVEVRNLRENRRIAWSETPMEEVKALDLSGCLPNRVLLREKSKIVIACISDFGAAPSFIFVWKYGEENAKAFFQTHRGPTLDCALSPDEKSLYTVGSEGLVKKWDFEAVLRAMEK